MKTRNMLILGGAGLAAYFLWKNQSASSTSQFLSPPILSPSGQQQLLSPDVSGNLAGNILNFLSGNTANLEFQAQISPILNFLSGWTSTISPTFQSTIGDILSRNTTEIFSRNQLSAELNTYLDLLSKNQISPNIAASLLGQPGGVQGGSNILSQLSNFLAQNPMASIQDLGLKNLPQGLFSWSPLSILEGLLPGGGAAAAVSGSGGSSSGGRAPATPSNPWVATQQLGAPAQQRALGGSVPSQRQAPSQTPAQADIASRLARGLM